MAKSLSGCVCAGQSSGDHITFSERHGAKYSRVRLAVVRAPFNSSASAYGGAQLNEAYSAKTNSRFTAAQIQKRDLGATGLMLGHFCPGCYSRKE